MQLFSHPNERMIDVPRTTDIGAFTLSCAGGFNDLESVRLIIGGSTISVISGECLSMLQFFPPNTTNYTERKLPFPTVRKLKYHMSRIAVLHAKPPRFHTLVISGMIARHVTVLAVRDLCMSYLRRAPTVLTTHAVENIFRCQDELFLNYCYSCTWLQPIQTHIRLFAVRMCSRVLFWFPNFEDALEECLLTFNERIHTRLTNLEARELNSKSWGWSVPTVPIYSISFAKPGNLASMQLNHNTVMLQVTTSRPLVKGTKLHIVYVCPNILRSVDGLCGSLYSASCQ